ncbi:MAG: DNA-binding NarL/FixJ family response regulator [Bacteroidia bacterium]|jgi:DNA-binding NarL/FixJ family response regulator
MDKLNIAIVDDHQLFADALKTVLPIYCDIDHISTFINGDLLLTHLESHDVDLVLLDLGIQEGMNGFETLKELTYRKPNIKAIVVSMHTQQEYIDKVRDLGGNGYLSKDAGALKLKIAINYVMANDKFYTTLQPDVPNPFNNLSPTESKIAKLIIKGKSNKAIAKELSRSKETIDTHRKSVYRKLDVNSIVDFIKLSVKYGMVTDAVE